MAPQKPKKTLKTPLEPVKKRWSRTLPPGAWSRNGEYRDCDKLQRRRRSMAAKEAAKVVKTAAKKAAKAKVAKTAATAAKKAEMFACKLCNKQYTDAARRQWRRH
jgi:hypothetical protein